MLHDFYENGQCSCDKIAQPENLGLEFKTVSTDQHKPVCVSLWGLLWPFLDAWRLVTSPNALLTPMHFQSQVTWHWSLQVSALHAMALADKCRCNAGIFIGKRARRILAHLPESVDCVNKRLA